MSAAIVQVSAALSDAVDALRFGPPVAAVYNPLRYAWEPHSAFLRRFGGGKGRSILLGMNPGPFGMAQTGVPFGEIASVRDWMGISGEVKRPPVEHPKRPILGFDCTRSEVSGRRLWGWARDTYGTPEAFFEQFFVLNYCPLVFMEDPNGRNRIPEKLPKDERMALFEVCDQALRDAIAVLEPERVIGVGAFAEKCAKRIVADSVPVSRVLHPSPASPAANRGWAEAATRQFLDMGIVLPSAPAD